MHKNYLKIVLGTISLIFLLNGCTALSILAKHLHKSKPSYNYPGAYDEKKMAMKRYKGILKKKEVKQHILTKEKVNKWAL